MYRMKALSECNVKPEEALEYFWQVPRGRTLSPEPRLEPAVIPPERAAKRLQASCEGQGRGAKLTAAKGTAWGLLNAVTDYVEHERRARSREYRLGSAWCGQCAGSNSEHWALPLN